MVMFMTRIAPITFGLVLIAFGLVAIHSGRINLSGIFGRYDHTAYSSQQPIFFWIKVILAFMAGVIFIFLGIRGGKK